MTRHFFSRPARAITPIVLTVAVVAGGVAVAGQTSATPQGTTKPQPATPQRGAMMMPDEAKASTMMAEREQMMAEMKAMDQKLNDLVAKMKTARGTEKVDALAAVVTELVAQRASMRDRMTAMQGRMMGHMMEHMMSMQGGMMSRGGQAGAGPSMANCPMMKSLEKEGGADDHAAHHPDAK